MGECVGMRIDLVSEFDAKNISLRHGEATLDEDVLVHVIAQNNIAAIVDDKSGA